MGMGTVGRWIAEVKYMYMGAVRSDGQLVVDVQVMMGQKTNGSATSGGRVVSNEGNIEERDTDKECAARDKRQRK